jgi:hypothetical protein
MNLCASSEPIEETQMIHSIRRVLPLALALSAVGAHAQYFKTHGFSVSVGGEGQYTHALTTNPNYYGVYTANNTLGTPEAVAVNNQQQYTTDSAGFLTSIAFHPKPWAGIEMNYGFTHYQERFLYAYTSAGNTTVLNNSTMTRQIPTDAHEATAAYEFHPKHIPFQPFVNIGGGAIDFAPRNASNQWRGAGLLETGFDLPTHTPHIGFRVEGRSLYYRAPNFYQAAQSTRSWRATFGPSASVYYHF